MGRAAAALTTVTRAMSGDVPSESQVGNCRWGGGHENGDQRTKGHDVWLFESYLRSGPMSYAPPAALLLGRGERDNRAPRSA